MKTKHPLLLASLSFLLLSINKTNAQATTASNTITSTNFLGSSNDLDVTFKRNNVFAGMLGTRSTSFGLNSFAPPANICTSIGYYSGYQSTGLGNTFLGSYAGIITSGHENIAIGVSAGSNTSGSNNVFVGNECGFLNGSGGMNVYLGNQAGHEMTGSGNVCIGAGSGIPDGDNIYSDNVFIGKAAGQNERGSNKLVINNTWTRKDLIWGDFAASQLKFQGKVGIGGNGTTAFGDIPLNTAGGIPISNYSLFVKGGILTEEVRVSLKATWADYVFLKDYKLPTLEEVEIQIKEKGHLRNVPSAKEVKENGIELGEMSKIQQEKIEELTLYIIEQNKVNQKQEEKIKTLENQAKELEELKAMVKVLIDKK